MTVKYWVGILHSQSHVNGVLTISVSQTVSHLVGGQGQTMLGIGFVKDSISYSFYLSTIVSLSMELLILSSLHYLWTRPRRSPNQPSVLWLSGALKFKHLQWRSLESKLCIPYSYFIHLLHAQRQSAICAFLLPSVHNWQKWPNAAHKAEVGSANSD